MSVPFRSHALSKDVGGIHGNIFDHTQPIKSETTTFFKHFENSKLGLKQQSGHLARSRSAVSDAIEKIPEITDMASRLEELTEQVDAVTQCCKTLSSLEAHAETAREETRAKREAEKEAILKVTYERSAQAFHDIDEEYENKVREFSEALLADVEAQPPQLL
eukprot:m.8713 g.8713  ORF g.8713 m.8713 type:complete len:162 (+) comp3314_c0_seq1:139-624(+)